MNIKRFNKLTFPLLAALALALVCGVAITAGSSSAEPAAAVPAGGVVPGFVYPPAASAAVAADRHAAFARRFALLRGAPRVVLASMAIDDPGIDRRAGREVTIASAQALARGGATPPEARIWVAPRYDGTVCLLPLLRDAQGPAETCATAEEAASGRLLMTQSRSNEDVDVYGLVPDGVDHVVVQLADGSRHELPVVGNAYAAHFDQPTDKLAFTGSDGEHQLAIRSDA